MTRAAAGLSRYARDLPRARRFEGTTVNVLQVAGEGVEHALQDKAPEIKELFGIDLVVTPVEIASMHTRSLASLRSQAASFDLIDVLGFWVTEMVGSGYFEPLQPYLDDPVKTPAGYDFADFIPGVVDYAGFYDVERKRFGEGELHLVPGVVSTSAVMYYRADLFDVAGLSPPATWEEYRAAAEALNVPGRSQYGTTVVGKVNPSLFLVDWYTQFVTRGGMLMSGSPAEGNYAPNLTSPEAVAALRGIVDLKAFAPPDVLEFGISESVQAMASGRVAMQLMWTTMSGSLFDSRSSTVADRIAVAPMPGEGPFAGQAIRGGWGFGIPRNSLVKEAAWQALVYLTSRAFERYQTATYLTTPNRRSVFEDPEVRASQPYLGAARDALERARILEIAAIPETFELIDVASRRFHAALSGQEGVEEALAKANEDWVEVLKRGGHLR